MLLLLSHSVVSDSLQPHGLQPTRLLCPWGFSRPEYWSGLSCPPPGDLPNPGIKPRSPALQADSLPAEPLGKPKNTGVGSPYLLQGIFQIQELNRWSPTWQVESLLAELPGKPKNATNYKKHISCWSFNFKSKMMPYNFCIIQTSLVVQWLRLCAPNEGGLGLIPGQGTRSHRPQLRMWVR